jgi:hypothetical protein
MTDRNRQRLEFAILAALFGAGAGWGAFQWQLSDLYAKVDRIDKRVSEWYCADQPAGCR